MLLYIIRDINIGIALITYNKGGEREEWATH